MKNKTLLILLFLLTLVQLICVSQIKAQEAKQLFQQGMMVENGQGNLEEAIKVYEQVLVDKNADNSVKAKAQLHIGLCYEKMGREEAIKAYELVVQDYKNYKDEVAVANSRLSELVIEKKDDGLKVNKIYDKDASVVEGTWLEAISVSPDGTHLVGIHFLEGQNVAMQDLVTKEVKLITHYSWTDMENLKVTYSPVWSPNGKEIAYWFANPLDSSTGIEIASLDGKTRELWSTKANKKIGNNVFLVPRQWTNDGKSIMTYVKDSIGVWTICMVSVGDGSLTPVFKTQWTPDRFISKGGAVSPDNRFLVFADGPSDNHDIFIMDLEGGSLTQVTNNPMNDTEPLWSPDGEYIVYIKEAKTGSYLYRQQVKEGKPSGSPTLIKENMQHVSMNNWTREGICWTMQVVLHDIYTLNLDAESGYPSGDPVPIDYSPTGINLKPQWSHDGKYFAFISKENDPEIVIMPVDGGEVLHFPFHVDGYWFMAAPSLFWSSDDSWLGFHIENSNNQQIVHMLNVATGEWTSRRLPLDGHTRVREGADNSIIYIESFADTTVGIFQWNMETDETKLLAKMEEDVDNIMIKQLNVSPDFKKAAFVLNSTMLMVYDLETGEGGLFKEHYWAPTFSPDSKQIIAVGRNDLATFTLEGEKLNSYPIRTKFEQGTHIWGFDCSPDGEKLTFHTRTWITEDYLVKNALKE